MPLSKYFGGHGESVMRQMKKKHGGEEGKRIFYATVNKNKGLNTGPSSKVRRKHGV